MSERVSNISSIVTSVINQLQEYGISGKDSAWLENIAVSFYSDRLRGFHMPSVTTVKFPVTLETRTWTLPPDFIAYTKIAYKCHNGMGIHILGLNEDMNISEPIATCAQPITSAPVVSDGYWLAEGGQQYQQPMFATGGGFAENYYRPDYANNCIRFMSNLPVGTAFIEYLGAGKGVSGQTIVPIAYRAAFEAWLMYRICMLKPKKMRDAPFAEFRTDAKMQMWDSNILAKGLTDQEHRDVTYRACGFNLR
jgi:hypothetical protein